MHRWSHRSLWLRVAVGAAGAALVLFVAVAILKWLPQFLSNQDLSGNEAAEDEGRVRTALLALLAGLLAFVGAVYTARTFTLNRAGQITERFTRAIDQLGSADVDVRLGGIYALERIARDSRDDHPQVIEVLTAYLREHAPWPPGGADQKDRASGIEALAVGPIAIEALERIAKDSAPEHNAPSEELGHRHAADDPPDSGESPLPRPPTDVQATLSVLGRRDRSQDKPGFRLNLARTDLRGVILDNEEAHLEGADLTEAHLEGADLSEAHLEGAELREAHLEQAVLRETHLEGARFRFAHLERANLNAARLEGAIFDQTHLEGAYLYLAHLEGANFIFAHLERATLSEARLQGASIGAYLEGANVENALYDGSTFWPDDFDAQGAGALKVETPEQD